MDQSSHIPFMRDFVKQQLAVKWFMLVLLNGITAICFAVFSDIDLGLHWVWIVPFLIVLLPVLLCLPLFYISFVVSARLERLKGHIVGLPNAVNAGKNMIVSLIDNSLYIAFYALIVWGLYKFMMFVGTFGE